MTTEEKSPRFMRANCQKIKYIYDPTLQMELAKTSFSILVKNRSKIIKKLKLKKINLGVHYKSILEFSLIIKKNLSKDARTCLFQKI